MRFKFYVLSILPLLRGFYMKWLRLNQLPTGQTHPHRHCLLPSKTSPPRGTSRSACPSLLPPAWLEQNLFPNQSGTDHCIPPVFWYKINVCRGLSSSREAFLDGDDGLSAEAQGMSACWRKPRKTTSLCATRGPSRNFNL